jgi:hypothetical protein
MLHQISRHNYSRTTHLGSHLRLLGLNGTRRKEKGQERCHKHQQYGHGILHGIKLIKISLQKKSGQHESHPLTNSIIK